MAVSGACYRKWQPGRDENAVIRDMPCSHVLDCVATNATIQLRTVIAREVDSRFQLDSTFF